jgi:hypothetical protein
MLSSPGGEWGMGVQVNDTCLVNFRGCHASGGVSRVLGDARGCSGASCVIGKGSCIQDEGEVSKSVEETRWVMVGEVVLEQRMKKGKISENSYIA